MLYLAKHETLQTQNPIELDVVVPTYIPATLEAKIRRTTVPGQPHQKASEIQFQQISQVW
jgi:hypothetical protein